MITTTFYQLLDNELDKIITNLQEKSSFPFKKLEQKKAYSFLVWILQFYGLTDKYIEFITDGADDNSCDIILNKKNKSGEEIFYIVQSKWNTISNTSSNIDAKDIKQTLNDFETILAGAKNQTKNSRFNTKVKELQNHLKKNGKAKFLFIALCNSSRDTDENINAFKQKYSPKISLDILDINRIKRDYIEMCYKEVIVDNPLNFDYRPEDVPITIEIERYNDGKRDLLEFNGDKKAYIFLIKPKVIFDLFEKFGFQLFYRNIRNPLIESNYNKHIAKSLLYNPEQFWYFNNGITAITNTIVEIGTQANAITLENLQVINGAQSLFTIYNCYKSASKKNREKMDNHAKITLRLIVSDDGNFNHAITQYTNSQNPLRSADFYANDLIQERLQIESYQYDIWYEKRRGEYRNTPKGIIAIDKELLTGFYLSCHFEEPVLANHHKKYHFVSKKDNKKGLYEYIFNDQTKFSDILASFKLFKVNIMSTYSKPGIDYPPDDRTMMPFLTLSKIVLLKCLQNKYKTTNLNINNYILKHHDDADFQEAHAKARSFVATNVFNKFFLNVDSTTSQQNFQLFFSNQEFFEEIKNWFKEMTLSFEIIEKYNKEVKAGPLILGDKEQ